MEEKFDPSDGLPAMEAGEWAEQKHDLLKKFVDISHAARRKFLAGSGAAYIELFSGPGRLFKRGTDVFIDGSPLVAHRVAARTQTPFTHMHLGDARPEYCDALRARLGQLQANVVTYPMPAEQAAATVVQRLNPNNLNFAFLDPFSLDMPFSIIETFARFRHMDILIHVSAYELMRKLPEYMLWDDCSLDRFAPGWRNVVKGMKPDVQARGRILEHWFGLIKKAGFKDAEMKPLIRGSSNQPLYWLVLIAKHELARTFWDAISKSNQNYDMFANP